MRGCLLAFGLLVTRKFIHGPCGLGLTCLCDIQASATLVLSFRGHDEVGSLEFFLWTMPNHTHSALFVICMSGEIFTFLFLVSLTLLLPGDVADDRFFHKTNDSDATQFSILYPRVGPHGMALACTLVPSHSIYCVVWAALWIVFALAVLAGFVILGIWEFKVRVIAACFLFQKTDLIPSTS